MVYCRYHFEPPGGVPLQCHPSDKPPRPIQEVRGQRRPSDRCRRQFSHVASPLIQIAEVHFGIAASQLMQMNRIRIRMSQQVSVQLTHWKPSQWNLWRFLWGVNAILCCWKSINKYYYIEGVLILASASKRKITHQENQQDFWLTWNTESPGRVSDGASSVVAEQFGFSASPSAQLSHNISTINHTTITSWCDSPVNPGVVFPSSGASVAQQTHSSVASMRDAKVFTFCASVRRDGPWDKTGVYGQRDRHAAHWKRALVQRSNNSSITLHHPILCNQINIAMLLGC